MQETSSKIEKGKILSENLTNSEFRSVLYYILNPFITTGLSEKKISKAVILNPNKEFVSIFDVMSYLQEQNTGTDQIIANIQNYLKALNSESQSFAKSVFTKSLMLGISAKTVNKLYGKEFIPTFECMLAEKYFEQEEFVEGKEFTITLKLDGIRCVILKKNGKVRLISRQGQLFEGLVEIENELLSMPIDNFALDGELLIINTEGIPSKKQYKATMKIVTSEDEVKTGVALRAFDYLPIADFENRSSVIKYRDRRAALEHDFCNSKFIKVLPALYTGKDIGFILHWLDKVRAEEQEGIMLNLTDAPYEFKRTKNLLKCKVMQDCDLQIIGFEEGHGRLAGTLGRINVNYKGNTLGVGSGLTDTLRKYFWAHQEELVGRVITIRYFEETEDKTGKKSLRFPVFKELREEGKEVSYS